MNALERIAAGSRFSIEIVPPSRGAGLDDLFRMVEGVMPYAPAFASVTDHPGGAVYGRGPNGPVLMSLRSKPGTLGTCLALRDAFGIGTVPHLVSARNDRFAAEDALIDLDYAGFRDVFVVRGDERAAPGMAVHELRPGEGYASAAELVAHVATLNRGEYSPPAGKGKPTSFTVGAACYPEKHFAAPNLDADLRALKEKVDAGVSFLITQMLFEARRYFEFVERARAAGIRVPIIPGIKPLTKASQATAIPKSFFVELPEALISALGDARTPDGERAAGIAWTVALAEELLEGGAPCVHFFTMGKGTATRDALDAVFGKLP